MSERDDASKVEDDEQRLTEDPVERDRPSHVESPAGRGRQLVAVALGLVALAGVVMIAVHRAKPPTRCPEGLVALGSRCCGDGQRLEQGRCTGAPSRCSTGMRVTPDGCVPEGSHVPHEGGKLELTPYDWEAAQQGVAPFEAEVAAFAIDRFEVTEARWRACVDAGACNELPLSGEPGRPVVGVTLEEAERFCQQAGGALPTKAEWAFAATGVEGRRYPWGDTGAVCRRAAFGLAGGPCGDGQGAGPDLTGAHPDGATPAGVQDLAGNVAEWTALQIEGKNAGKSAVRGGSWRDMTATELRTWSERMLDPTTRADDVGFRCVYPVEGG